MNNNIDEALLHIEQQLLQLRQDLLAVRLEIAQLKHSKDTIKINTDSTTTVDDQNRRTARR